MAPTRDWSIKWSITATNPSVISGTWFRMKSLSFSLTPQFIEVF